MNILVISFDALRPDALGIYGAGRRRSPRIDRWAKRSHVYERAYSVAPVTPTSFAAVFSGSLPIYSFQRWRFVSDLTLAQELARAGYYTAAFVNNVHLSPERSFDRGFDLYDWRPNDPDEQVVEDVVAWLDSRPAETPFFLWVHLLRPHAPYLPREGSEHLFDVDYRGPFEKGSGNSFHPTTTREIERIKDLYASEVWFADQLFGRLIDAFNRHDLLDTSLLILTADHGEELGEHGGFQHGRLYEEHLRIPLIVGHPDARYGRAHGLVRNAELFPALLAAIGADAPPPFGDFGEPASSFAQVPADLIAISMTEVQEISVSLLRDSQKLIFNCSPEPRFELFDLAHDPEEFSNLADQRPTAVAALQQRLMRSLGGEPCQVVAAAVQGSLGTMGLNDPESINALRALGYIE